MGLYSYNILKTLHLYCRFSAPTRQEYIFTLCLDKPQKES